MLNDSDDYGLVPLVRAVLRHAVPALLVATAVFLGVFQYQASQPDEYTSVSVVSFSPRVDRNLGADTLQVLAAKYVAYLSSPATLRQVAEEIGQSERELEQSVRSEIPPATANLSVSATSEDPARAARAANALAAAAARESIDDANLRAELVAPGVVPVEPSGPPRNLILAAGLVVAAGAGLLTVLVLSALRRLLLDAAPRSATNGTSVREVRNGRALQRARARVSSPAAGRPLRRDPEAASTGSSRERP